MMEPSLSLNSVKEMFDVNVEVLGALVDPKSPESLQKMVFFLLLLSVLICSTKYNAIILVFIIYLLLMRQKRSPVVKCHGL
jgi:hypothetical protein